MPNLSGEDIQTELEVVKTNLREGFTTLFDEGLDLRVIGKNLITLGIDSKYKMSETFNPDADRNGHIDAELRFFRGVVNEAIEDGVVLDVSIGGFKQVLRSPVQKPQVIGSIDITSQTAFGPYECTGYPEGDHRFGFRRVFSDDIGVRESTQFTELVACKRSLTVLETIIKQD